MRFQENRGGQLRVSNPNAGRMRSPLTQSTNTKLLTTIDPKVVVERWAQGMGIDIRREFNDVDRLEYWQCCDTGLRWYEPSCAAGGGRNVRRVRTAILVLHGW